MCPCPLDKGFLRFRQLYSRFQHDAVVHVYDEASNVNCDARACGRFQRMVSFFLRIGRLVLGNIAPTSMLKVRAMTVSCFAFTTLFLCALCECALGAEAVFSNDGQHIYALVWAVSSDNKDIHQLRHIDLSKATIKLIALKDSSGSDLDLVAVSRSDNEDILCPTATALWRYHPADATCTKVCDAPQDVEFIDVAYNPKTQAILLPARATSETEVGPLRLFLLKDVASTPEDVVVWRLDCGVECPVFDANGELFFSNCGDLWQGEVVLSEVTEGRPALNEGRPALRGYRYAPLATLETDVGSSPAQRGVREIAVARDFIYVFTKRIWGTGYEQLAQVPRPATKRLKESVDAFDKHLDLPDRWRLYRHVLDSAKILTRVTMKHIYLCASADESRVYYTVNDKHWLITHGKPRELRFDRAQEASPEPSTAPSGSPKEASLRSAR
jgi:hypothetical protein